MNFSRAFLAISLLCVASAGHASTWIEGSGNVGDAPHLSPGQNTIGDSGNLASIQGRFEFDDVDVYKIKVTSPAIFRATTVGLAGTLDTQLFLFTESGMGVTHNDDDPGTNSIQSTITGQFIGQPGTYYLAITQYNRDPQSVNNRFQWNNTPFDVERAPDGNGANEAWTKWTDEPLLDGDYEIQLFGADFAETGTTPPPPQENIWTETSDAPSLLPGQMTFGEGRLVRIDGALSNLNDVDMYCIVIDQPSSFHASTVGQIDFDSQLYLFDSNGMGVTFNDDDPAITGSWSILSGQHVLAPGTYYLAITKWDQDPRSSNGYQWQDQPSTVERAPDGPGAANPLDHWDGNGIGRTGAYSIIVRGAKFCQEGFTLVTPDAYTMFRGRLVSGGLTEMTQSDNAYGVFGPGVVLTSSEDPLVLDFLGALPTNSPTTFDLLFEGRGTAAALAVKISVFDFSTNVWVQIHAQNLPAGADPDLVLALDLMAMPNIIGPDNKVRTRIAVRASGPVLLYPWRTSIDQVAWRIQTQ